MSKFMQYYFKDNTFYIPIDLNLCSMNEMGELEIGIPLKYLSELLKHDVVRISTNGKRFNNLKEAYSHFDNLTEAEKKKASDKLKTKVTDPETGVTREFEVAAGNAKIGGDTVLLNMSTAGNCMSAILGTCKLGPGGMCYALRFEKQWQDSLKKNIRHEEQWACLTARGIAQGLIQIEKVMPSLKYIRVNEAGEFRNLPSNPELLAKVSDEKKKQLADVDDVGKLKQIGEELLKLGSKLTLYTYTHRSDLNVGDLGTNVCVNGSGHMIDNNFVPLDLDEFNNVLDMIDNRTLKEFNGEPVVRGVHCMGDCRVCNFCKKKEKKHIFLPIHGSGTPYQKQIENILTSVVNNPEFVNIFSSNEPIKEKAEKALMLVPEEMKKTFQRLIPIRKDRLDMFLNIIKSKGNKDVLIKSLESYVKNKKASDDGSINVNISNNDSNEALIKSIDSLTGKFQQSIEQAKSLGKAPALKKWNSLTNSLQKAIQQIERGETPKVTGALAKQHAGILGKLKQ